MSNLRMRPLDTAIELSVENDAAANTCSDRDVDQPLAIASRPPTGFGKRGGVAVVFQRNPELEHLRQIFHRTFPTPSRQKIDIPEFAAHRIDRPGGSDSDTIQFCAGFLRGLAQHMCDQFERVGITIGIGRRFHARKHLAAVIDHAHRDFGSANIDGANHEYSGVMALASSSVIRFLFL